MIILSILFFVTAIFYSSVGFGGGSTYLALLLIWGIPYSIFPVIALTCNIIVVFGNCFNYIRAGNLNIKLLLSTIKSRFLYFDMSPICEEDWQSAEIITLLPLANFIISLINSLVSIPGQVIDPKLR